MRIPHGHPRDGHPGHRGRHGHPGAFHHGGPQTFRRGRALQFLEFLDVRRSTLLRQLEQPEFADIRPVLTGELKAVESIRDEFIAMFDLWPAAGESESRADVPDAPSRGADHPTGDTPSEGDGA
ncbi:hypothetical protein [Alicyclobacillus fructus]|uniref:hypothetical protein n=1 Tax=Alicyclobacillus fructus TaxID=2816082 RepID=UPI001A8D9BE6|nr:hypothetical protein [Alicyclobacillus fructus]